MFDAIFCGNGLNIVPDGVIGNTWAFGAYVPGSSPGRVVFYVNYIFFDKVKNWQIG